jgi:hypothetical protein
MLIYFNIVNNKNPTLRRSFKGSVLRIELKIPITAESSVLSVVVTAMYSTAGMLYI